MNDEKTQAKLRKAFEIANGIVMLEGWRPDASVLERQERVIRGELSCRELVDELVRSAKATNQQCCNSPAMLQLTQGICSNIVSIF